MKTELGPFMITPFPANDRMFFVGWDGVKRPCNAFENRLILKIQELEKQLGEQPCHTTSTE